MRHELGGGDHFPVAIMPSQDQHHAQTVICISPNDLHRGLCKKTQPNYPLLNNAIKQTVGKDIGITEKNLQDFLLKNIQKIDFEVAKKDIERFLEDSTEIKLLDYQIIHEAIKSAYPQ